MSFSKVICVLDADVDVQDVGQVAWRLLANLDPKRDFALVDGPIDQLDHGANQALWGSKVCVDGTRKWREEGYMREWPEPCRMSPEVQARVAAMWPELGIDTKSASDTGESGSEAASAMRSGRPARRGSMGDSAIARVIEAARDFLARASE